MKILLDHPLPFIFAHGGAEVQLHQSLAGLKEIGVGAEFLRWWDATQPVDLVHCFSMPVSGYLELARKRGLPVVLTAFFSATCNRPTWRLAVQALATRAILSQPFG